MLSSVDIRNTWTGSHIQYTEAAVIQDAYAQLHCKQPGFWPIFGKETSASSKSRQPVGLAAAFDLNSSCTMHNDCHCSIILRRGIN